MGFLRLRLIDENRKDTEVGGKEVEGAFAGRRTRDGQCVVIADSAIVEEEVKLIFSGFPFLRFLYFLESENMLLYICDSGWEILNRKILAVESSDGFR
ncbi:hypothetical protein ACFX1S_019418 [Malus domestica]